MCTESKIPLPHFSHHVASQLLAMFQNRNEVRKVLNIFENLKFHQMAVLISYRIFEVDCNIYNVYQKFYSTDY